jgi:3-phosphoshikimate 1-carboxyvinyltransferase
MADNLSHTGAHITATEVGRIIEGGYPLHGAAIDSHLDHRIAMSFAVASLAANGETTIKGADCVNIGYPNFYKDLSKLSET